jgi:membrane protease YdiL (CAAX protease family)
MTGMDVFGSYIAIGVFCIFCVFGGYIVFNSYHYHRRVPWDFLLIFFGIVTLNVNLKISFITEIYFNLSWLFLVWFLYLKKDNLEKFFITTQHLAHNVIMGLILGAVMIVLVILGNIEIPITQTERQNCFLLVWQWLETPIQEELLFRSFLLGFLINQGHNGKNANFMQTSLFLLAHLPKYYGGNWQALILVALMGYLNGYITWRKKNIVAAILIHALINLPFNIGFVINCY